MSAPAPSWGQREGSRRRISLWITFVQYVNWSVRVGI
jgi:hypothetical protein